MKNNDINIRDPFVLYENGKYYMCGTRANNFGKKTGGFDVYVSENLENWSEPIECFNSEEHNLNYQVNWAPEVHKYKDAYYMFATFTRESNGLRGTFILKADSPLGPFVPHSNGAVTPEDWECLDGTLYLTREGKPYAECLVRFNGGEIGTDFTHLEPLIDDDGGHGMILPIKINFILHFIPRISQALKSPVLLNLKRRDILFLLNY